MSESGSHKELVKMIIGYVVDKVGEDNSCFIETDYIDDRPLPDLTTEGFRPDVAYEYNGLMIIGEAKTSDDVARDHSIAQYASYLKKCALYQGSAEYIMAVPWTEQALANNIIKKMRKDIPGDYEVKIIKGIV